jgi:hypothetical protein
VTHSIDDLKHGEQCGAFLVPDQNLICFVGAIFEPLVAELSDNRISVHAFDRWRGELEWVIDAIAMWLDADPHAVFWQSKTVEWAQLDRDQVEDFRSLLIEARSRKADLVSFSF